MISQATIPFEAPASSASPRTTLAKSPPTTLLLAAVGLVVVLVSMPRLAQWAAAGNQADAAQAAQVLGPLLSAAPAAHTLGTLMRSTSPLRHRFSNARPLGAGYLVEHHGYLLARAEGGILFAWPLQSGRTGESAYAWTPDSGLLVHPNKDHRWTGRTQVPQPRDLELRTWRKAP